MKMKHSRTAHVYGTRVPTIDFSVRTILLAVILFASITVLGFNPETSPRSAGKFSIREQAPQQMEEVRASATLVKLRVPLERDPLGRVRWIRAADGQLSDEVMRHLSALPLLEWLEIGGGNVTAAGMAFLKSCPALRRLYIHDVQLGNDPLHWLAGLRPEALSLQRAGIDGRVLKQLRASDRLTVLNLSGNDITDDDMVEVAGFKNLEVLALKDTRVTGAGLASLRDMAKLNVLNLVNCRIGDADLEHFESMPNLRIVRAVGCNISDDAVDEINKKRPLLSIFR